MNESENQFFSTRAASSTSGRTPKQIPAISRKHAVTYSVVVLLCAVGLAQAELMVWDAGLGRLPHELTPAWDWTGPTSGEQATFDSGVLTIRSVSNVNDNVYFSQSGMNLSVPNNVWVETSVRFVSGTSNQPSRAPVCFGVTTKSSVGNGLWITKDRIFVMTGLWTTGQSADVDTDDAFHTYRIEVDGTNSGSSLRVYYDGALTLTGTTFSDTAANGSEPRVYWGDGTKYEGGVSEWKYVAHNASAFTGVWLTCRTVPTGVQVAWSTAAYGFVLQSKTNLLVQTLWEDDPSTPSVADHEKFVDFNTNDSRFFRLRGP